MWKRYSIVLGLSLTVFGRPLPSVPLVPRQPSEDAKAKEWLLKSFGKDAKDVAEAKFKCNRSPNGQ
jgi:hypothetical protein